MTCTFKEFLEDVAVGRRKLKRPKTLTKYGAAQPNMNVNHETNDGGMSGPNGVSNAEYYTS